MDIARKNTLDVLKGLELPGTIGSLMNMSLNGKPLLKPVWRDGKPYCKVCVNEKPLIILVEKAEYILYACVPCHRLYRGKAKTMKALEELEKIKNHLGNLKIEKRFIKRSVETWKLCRDITKELAEYDRKIHSY